MSLEYLVIIAQIVLALGIYNVWLVRFQKSTPWRGGDASNLKEEFATYGLPYWFMLLVGALKLIFATLLLVGLWFPSVTKFSALGLGVLMVGAVSMHLKVKDPLKKSIPSFIMLLLCLFVALYG